MTTTLEPWADGVWTSAAPLSMLGLRLGTRMTVVRLPGGGLLLHSPIAPDDTLAAAIDALGTVTHIVAPNLYHHLYAGEMARRYPKAMLHGPAELAKKRRDLTLHAALGETPHPDWKGALVPVTIDGCMLRETVFVHPPSRSVISSDLCENFGTSEHWPTRMYLKAAGVHGRVGWSRFLRFVYRDHAAARRSIDRLLEHDFDRLVLAHGDPLASAAKEALRATFTFLA